ncbi:hypothetical protein A6B34_13935 [Mycolicibacterium monacense]|jgi:hypothetical protein|nr:hypothetical protein A6B34_13935 [Mycolicibacterium monacense]
MFINTIDPLQRWWHRGQPVDWLQSARFSCDGPRAGYCVPQVTTALNKGMVPVAGQRRGHAMQVVVDG